MAREFDCKIVLENGREFYGYSFGARKEAICEAVCDTSMVGYQEILSDPSYAGQLVVLTYPLIGCYGINDEDFESRQPAMGGLVVKEYNNEPSNFRFTTTLAETMEEHGIPGISGVETRTVARILRDSGSSKMMLTAAATPVAQAVAQLRDCTLPTDLVARVSCKKKWYARTSRHQYNVVALDCGLKLGLVRSLNLKDCNVTVVPYNTPADEILKLCPDGLVVAGGPGDPRSVPAAEGVVRTLRGRLPILGVGLGCQLVALAYGAAIQRLPHGHRGTNQPVRCLATGKLTITTQNHAYAVDEASLAGTGLRASHVNQLDGSIEGVCSEVDSVFAVQYYPANLREAAPEEHLDCFIAQMDQMRAPAVPTASSR